MNGYMKNVGDISKSPQQEKSKVPDISLEQVSLSPAPAPAPVSTVAPKKEVIEAGTSVGRESSNP